MYLGITNIKIQDEKTNIPWVMLKYSMKRHTSLCNKFENLEDMDKFT